jgi:hypothetical protein
MRTRKSVNDAYDIFGNPTLMDRHHDIHSYLIPDEERKWWRWFHVRNRGYSIFVHLWKNSKDGICKTVSYTELQQEFSLARSRVAIEVKKGKERMFAMADAFTASMLMVLTRKSPIYIGDENLYVSEDGGVSRYEITGAMALAMTEVMDRIGLGNGKRPTRFNELLHILTDTVIDMISDRCVEMARQEMGPLPNDREKEESMENNVEMPMIFNNDNRKPN